MTTIKGTKTHPGTRSKLWCCGCWHPITHMPLRCHTCGRVYLAWWPERPATTKET
jgi:hypothetical protein